MYTICNRQRRCAQLRQDQGCVQRVRWRRIVVRRYTCEYVCVCVCVCVCVYIYAIFHYAVFHYSADKRTFEYMICKLKCICNV